jgi:RHS repeat-associated protein
VITPIAHQPLPVEVPLEQLALMPTNDLNPKRYDGEAPVYKPEPIRVASLGSFVGILSHTVVAQVTQPKVYYFLNDHLGTPLLITDENNKVVWEGRYQPFGQCTVHPFSTIENNFRFWGQVYDSETELHYNYHRYYQPRVGRYLTPDPIGLGGDYNLFSYVGNNPRTYVDPFGLKRLSCKEVRDLVQKNNRSGLSNELVICIVWNESSFDPDAPHQSKTEKGLMAMTKDAASDAGFESGDMKDSAKNIAAGTAYLKLRIKWAKGSIEDGIRGFGTGKTYPVQKVLDCEKCLKNEGCGNPQACLDLVHR